MKYRVSDLVREVKLSRQATIKHFCKEFEVLLDKHCKNGHFVSDAYISDELFNFFVSFSQFVRDFEKDYYADKSIQTMAELTGKSEIQIRTYLIHSGRKVESNSVFRYITTYEIIRGIDGRRSLVVRIPEPRSSQNQPLVISSGATLD